MQRWNPFGVWYLSGKSEWTDNIKAFGSKTPSGFQLHWIHFLFRRRAWIFQWPAFQQPCKPCLHYYAFFEKNEIGRPNQSTLYDLLCHSSSLPSIRKKTWKCLYSKSDFRNAVFYADDNVKHCQMSTSRLIQERN